jgi:hypothetical protein
MSWDTIQSYTGLPFFPSYLPFQKYIGSVAVETNTIMSASQTLLVTQTVPAIPANSTILFYQLQLTNEDIYPPTDVRIGAVRLVNGNTQYQFTITTSANVVGTHRTYSTFVLFYENSVPL